MLSPSILSSSLDVELLRIVAKQLVALGPLTPSPSVKLFGDEEGMMGHLGRGAERYTFEVLGKYSSDRPKDQRGAREHEGA
jgi:hypothetical protein